MSNLHQMLAVGGGSFKQAELIALGMISEGRADVFLDLSLLRHSQGNVKGAKQALLEYAKHFPDCQRLRFASTWFKLYDGDLQGGLEYTEAGRAINCLGCPNFEKFECPRWDGKTNLMGKVVVLYCEGGLGDQIMGLRAAHWLRELNAEVVVGCSKQLMGLFADQGTFNVVELEGAFNVRADYFVPSMSGARLCQRTWDTLWTGQYIKAPESEIWNRIIPPGRNIGLRWRGNPKFEHEQLRLFPSELMSELSNIPGATYWSLQKDERQLELPKNVIDLEPLLGDWRQTAAAIARMDLVITSCTAIAHLSAAMNKPTWIVVPIMPYYPWARPGKTSFWYPSVTLFRQKCFGTWIEPFVEVRECLERRLKGE